MMRCVLYLRMSTDRQEASIPQQRDAIVAFAARNGREIVGEYLDEGISGDATNKRKGFQAMIRDAAGGGFDRILCWDQSRFGRFDSIEAGSWITPLRDAGVSLETIDGGVIDWSDFAGRVTFAVSQEAKHAFLRDLSRSSLRGMAAKIRDGRGIYGGSTPYGYRRETAIVDRRPVSTFALDETTAPVVRRMFHAYAEAGGSLNSVVVMLNDEGVPSPYGRAQWRRGSVRRVLANPIYAGDISWGRTMSGKYHARVGDEIVARRPGQRRARNVPIVHRDALPAIVDRRLFDAVQELLVVRKKATRRSRSTRPLSGLVTCGHCGSPMHVDGPHYRCSRGVDFGHNQRCGGSVARADHLLDAVADGLRRNLLASARLRSVKAKLARLVEAQRKEITAGDPAALDRRIAELDRQVAEGIARIPLLPKSLVADMAKGLDTVRSQRDALTRQREALEKAQEGDRLPVDDRVASAIAAAYGLRDALGNADPAVVNASLRSLGVRVSVAVPAGTVTVDPLADEEIVGTCRAPVPTRDKSHGPLVSFEIALAPVRRGPRPRRAAG